eukprot:6429802-Prymnesium_polylepis.1
MDGGGGWGGRLRHRAARRPATKQSRLAEDTSAGVLPYQKGHGTDAKFNLLKICHIKRTFRDNELG